MGGRECERKKQKGRKEEELSKTDRKKEKKNENQ